MAKKLDVERHRRETIAQYDRVEQSASPRVLAYLNATREKDRALLAKTMAKFKKPRSG